jgi:hypothetical protein
MKTELIEKLKVIENFFTRTNDKESKEAINEAIALLEPKGVSAEEVYIKCHNCNGDGYTIEAECCRKGEEQCCGIPIPIQVECEHCKNTKYIPMHDYAGQSDAVEFGNYVLRYEGYADSVEEMYQEFINRDEK